MSTTLVVDLGLVKSPIAAYLNRVECNLTVDDNAVSSQQQSGASRTFTFSASAGTSVVQLSVSVPRPGWNTLCTFTQLLKVNGSSLLIPSGSSHGNVLSLHPSLSSKWPRHPRVTVTRNQPGDWKLSVDLMFVEFTNVVRGDGKLRDYDEVFYQVDGVSEFEPNDNHHGCELHIYEKTQGNPKAWAIIVPKAALNARERGSYNVLVFLQPALQEWETRDYTDAETCSYKDPNLPRYSHDPARWGPFFYQEQQKPDGTKWFLRKGWPYAGFEGQLAASGKPVLLVMPYGMGAKNDYGDAVTADLKGVLASLITALWGDGHIGDEQYKGAELGRVGLAGYSAGANAASVAFTRIDASDKSFLKELYLFDCLAPFPAEPTLAAWLKRDGGNRLRLIGGQTVDKCIGLITSLRNQLDPTTAMKSVAAAPDSAAFYDTRGTTWEAALFPPCLSSPATPATGCGPDTLSTWNPNAQASTFSKLSQDSGVFVQQTNPMTLFASATGQTAEVNVTSVEAAGLVRLWQVVTNKQKVANAQDFKDLCDGGPNPPRGTGVIHDMRHQWAVNGGAGNTARYPYGVQKSPNDTSVFEGYLHYCLKDSGFA
jgi:hypothetical protein